MSLSSRKLIVAALALTPDGNVLLTRRPEGKPHPGQWELPGGKVEAGESPESALRRELVEELGCDARIGAIESVLHHDYEAFEVVILVYRVELLGVPQPLEVAEVRWVAPADLTALPILPADRPLILQLQQRGPRAR